jgi:hypothetical protein
MRIFLAFMIMSMIGSACAKKKSAQESNSNLASIVVGKVKQEVLAHDSVVVTVEKGGSSSTFSTSAELASAKFKDGDSITISMTLSKSGKVVAESVEGSARCAPVSAVLKKGSNKFKIPLCSVGSKDSDDPIIVDPDSNADVEVDPCITDKEKCDDKELDSTGTDKKKDDTKTADFPGKCIKETAIFKTANGGCQYQETGMVLSKKSHFNGTYKELTFTEADSYCSNLVEGGYSDWAIPSETQLLSMKGRGLGFSLNTIKDGISAEDFWTSTTRLYKGKSKRIAITIQNNDVRINDYDTSYGQNDALYVICVRK